MNAQPLSALLPELRRLTPAIRSLAAEDSDVLLDALAVGLTRRFRSRITTTFLHAIVSPLKEAA